jgi:hypothetical protein
VRDCFLPLLADAGMKIVMIPRRWLEQLEQQGIPRLLMVTVYQFVESLIASKPAVAIELIAVAHGLVGEVWTGNVDNLSTLGLVEHDGTLRSDVRAIVQACARMPAGQPPASWDDLHDVRWHLPKGVVAVSER